MTEAAVTTFPCPRCGNLLYAGTLACPNCGALVYAQRLNEIAAHAQQTEQVNPVAAAQVWQQALPLLPQDSQQYQMVQQRIGALLSGYAAPVQYAQPEARPNDPLGVALAKTIGSMLISIVAYDFLIFHDLFYSTVFVILILIHEMGHVLAMRYYGLRAGPPIFIPFIGALINLRQRPKDALQEAVVGIGGPFLGTVGALACFALAVKLDSPSLLQLSCLGFVINLFNMVPVPPLDGGRITAAVSPWIWIPGLMLIVGKVAYDWFVEHRISFILLLILLYAWPRIRNTLARRHREDPYYNIGRIATWSMGAAYAGLTILLIGFTYHTGVQTGLLRLFQ